MLAAAMMREAKAPQATVQRHSLNRESALHRWKIMCVKLGMIGDHALARQKLAVILGQDVFNRQFGQSQTPTDPTLEKVSIVHPGARLITMGKEQFIMGARIQGDPKDSQLAKVSEDLCTHPIASMDMKGSNQHAKVFRCKDCNSRFHRHPVEDHHPPSSVPPAGTDRITWGSLFGVTYQEALCDRAWCQLCLSQAEDVMERRPWILRFARYVAQQEGLQVNTPVPQPGYPGRSEETPGEEVRPEDSVSMVSPPASVANTARTRSHAGKRR